MALALQRSLLPRGLPEQDAVEVAYRYLPAEAGRRRRLVRRHPAVRRPRGARRRRRRRPRPARRRHHGPAAHRRAQLLRPGPAARRESSTHLDDLVARIDQDETGRRATAAPPVHRRHLPVRRSTTRCRGVHHGPRRPSAARAGPPRRQPWSSPTCPPARRSASAGCPSRPPSCELPEGSQLVLYTDGLIEDRHRDIDDGPGAAARRPGATPARAPEETCRAVLDALLPAQPERRHRPARRPYPRAGRRPGRRLGRAAPTRPPSREVRAAVTGSWTDWGLDELAFTTELILSELVTNAIRYGAGPIRRTADPRPHPDLRGLRHQQHLPASAARGHHRRGRPRPVPRRPARRALGHPLHPERQGHLGRTALALPEPSEPSELSEPSEASPPVQASTAPAVPELS